MPTLAATVRGWTDTIPLIFLLLWPWILAALLLFAGLYPRILGGWLKSIYYCISQRYYAPVAAIVSVIALIVVCFLEPDSDLWFKLALVLCFASFCWVLWPKGVSEQPPEDLLHRGFFVDQLTEIFISEGSKLRRVAILGTWGTGKTTVLQLLSARLRASKRAKFRVAFVNPWKAGTPEEAWAIVAKGFDQALGLPSPLSRNWARHPTLTGLFRLLPLPGVGDDLVSIFEGGGRDADMRRVEKINRLLERRKIKLVILVDDMERAEPEVIRKMFPIIDRLSDLKNCFFVFAIDRDRVGKAFKGDGQGADEAIGYLDKVFDLQLELPEPLTEDIAEMCEALLDKEVCPKLASCFNEIKPILSTSPRAARKFLNLAETKEALFLVRYQNDEHPYLPFFVLWMLESEYPGSIEVLLEHEKAVDDLVSFTIFDKNEAFIEKESFKDVQNALRNRHPSLDHLRLEVLVESFVKTAIHAHERVWLEKSGFDFRWALYGHMRLLELSVDERRRLEERWRLYAGCESINEMIFEAVPGGRFSNHQRCAEQLLEDELQRIEQFERDSYRITSNDGKRDRILSALAATQRLRAHFLFSVKLKLPLDLGKRQ